MLLTDKYADKIYGIITCYDRMIIQGYIPNWSHAEAMTTYMKLNGIRIFDYPSFSQPLTEQVRQNAENIAQENGIEIEFIRKLHAFRKDDRIQKIISETGITEGLVHIFSAMGDVSIKMYDKFGRVLRIESTCRVDISRSLILSYNRRIDAGKVQTYLQFSKM